MTAENWEPHPTMPRLEVSTHGRVRIAHGRMLNRDPNAEYQRFKSIRPNKRGTKVVNVRNSKGQVRQRSLARMVLETFGTDFDAQKHEVIFKNGDRSDCRLENLTYG